MMLSLAESAEPHVMRWVVEAVRHAAHEEAPNPNANPNLDPGPRPDPDPNPNLRPTF